MNKRERTLLFALLGLLICVGGYGMFYFLYQKPMEALDRRLADAEGEIQTKNLELAAGLKEREQIYQRNPHLKVWPKVSLPEMVVPAGKNKTPDETLKHLSQVQVDYQRYLSDLLRDSGFNPATINVSPRPVDNKSSPTIAGKGPLYTKLQFNVTASASLAAVVKMMERFHHDPLLQEVHTLTLDKPQTTVRKDNTGKPEDLTVNMTIEALLVTNAEPRAELKPTFDTKDKLAQAGDLHGGDRNYEDIVIKKNIFNGYRPGGGGGGGPSLIEDRKEVLKEVKLTTVNRTRLGRWEATLYHQGQGERDSESGLLVEHKLDDRVKTKFTINDRYENKVVAGEVALIDDHTIVIAVDGKYYRMVTGDFLSSALEKPLTDAEIKDLGLKPLVVKAEPEKEKDKKPEPEKSESAKKPEPKPEAEEPDQ